MAISATCASSSKRCSMDNPANDLDKTLRALLAETALSTTGTRYFCIRANGESPAIAMAVFSVDPRLTASIEELLVPQADKSQGPL